EPMPKIDSSKVPPRAEHPYHMYDAMMAQPAALEAVLDAPGDAFERAAEALTEADRVYLTGMGTSLHAATVGRYLLEHALGTAVEAGRAAGRTAPAEALAKDLAASPKGVAGILKKEGRFVAIAEDLASTESVVLLGTGPDIATAREGALKIVETSYVAVHPYE